MICNAYHLFFTNLANKTRFAIIMALRKSELSVNEIVKEITEEQSNVSHHLKHLISCNIVFVRQEGKKRVYSLNKNVINPILKIIDNHVKNNCDDCIYKNIKKEFSYVLK